MAALVASVPLPLLLDSFLASSWTWLALSLATIATLLRTLGRSCSLSRFRPQALLPPPPSVLSSETERISSFTSELLHPLLKAQECRNQSTSGLENLLQKPDALACPELRFFSRMHGCDATPLLLCDAGMASDVFNGQPCSVFGESCEGALRLCRHAMDYQPGSMLRLGFFSDTQKEGLETATTQGDAYPNHLCTSSDACSRCKPRQNCLFDAPCSPSEVPLCFEMQFGWSKLLDTRLGAPWRNRSIGLGRWASIPATYDAHIVKVWSTPQRNLLKALKVEGSSVTALDVRGGLAFIACRNGEVSRWDISNQACLDRFHSSVKSISAICSNTEKGVVVARNEEFLGLWDRRCPSLAPILDKVNASPYSALRCEGEILHIGQVNGVFSSCDLRKPQGSRLSLGANLDSSPVVSKMEEDEPFVLWEKLSSDEDDVWDEHHHIGYGNVTEKMGFFALRCATLVRSLSSSG